jgi:hypothetical protein
MTTSTHPTPFAVANPLKAKLNTGIAKPDAVRKAEENLAVIKDKTLAEIDGVLMEMQTLATQLSQDPTESGRDALYRLSNRVAAVAGTFDKGALGEAAYCLCDLLDRTNPVGKWPAGSITVHLEGMKVLRHLAAADDSKAVVILHGLCSVVNHVAPKPE